MTHSHLSPSILAALLSLPFSQALPQAQPSLADLPDPDPAAQLASFRAADGLSVSLFAADPLLRKPVQMNWDAAGRLWVVSSTTYPHIVPGAQEVDQIVVLEDTDGDGVADKSTVFADDLHIPTGVIPGDGGAYVANSTELLFLKDTTGDGVADQRTVMLSGFGTEDTHHLIHTFRHSPGGLLHFTQSIYIHSHIETPYGIRRLLGGGIWRFRPESRRLEVVAKGLINSWGTAYDRWGQPFATDGAGSEGLNFFFPGAVFRTSPGAERILSGMSPGQPKLCGLTYFEHPGWPADWQRSFLTCDFRGGRINRFSLREQDSGFFADQAPDVLTSSHRAFRPIDVLPGPDGALYVADWYNPIIQHGEVDFRDPRRDHTHGRIWRIAPHDLPTAPSQLPATLPTKELFPLLASPSSWHRHFAVQEIRHRAAAHPVEELWDSAREWLKRAELDPETAALATIQVGFAMQALDLFDRRYVSEMLDHPLPEVRAAALTLLYERASDEDPAFLLPTLQRALADPHPRVRLWAISVARERQEPAFFFAALHALDLPVDNNIDFLLEQWGRHRADQWLPAYLDGSAAFSSLEHEFFALRSARRPETAAPLLDRWLDTKPDAPDAPALLNAVAETGGTPEAERILSLLELATQDSQQQLSVALAQLARRNVPQPANAAARLTALLANDDQQRAANAARTIGAWKLGNALPAIQQAAADTARPAVQHAALEALGELGEPARPTLAAAAETGAAPLRTTATIALAPADPALAARLAVALLQDADLPATESDRLLGRLFSIKDFPTHLATALDGQRLPQPVAVAALRLASQRGLDTPILDKIRVAGDLRQMDKPLSPEEMAALVGKVESLGDPHRGQVIYRRQELLCAVCHAIGGAGGLVGPDMISIGASAPIDYLIESLTDPSAKIKEGYHTTTLTLADGTILMGGLVTDGQEAVVIRDAAGTEHRVPTSEITARSVSPVSLMPPGLTNSLREDEFIDLVAFMAQLGKEGDFKTPPNAYVRRWRTMGELSPEQVDLVRHRGLAVLNDPELDLPWQPAPFWSLVDGALPLYELSPANRLHPWYPYIAQFEIEVVTPGPIHIAIENPQGIIAAVGERLIDDIAELATLELPQGRHPITLVIQTRLRQDITPHIRVELHEIPGGGRATLP
jgi:putative heme-binding domain-containing protein